MEKTVKIPAVSEYDVCIQFPGGVKWTLQYRNYAGNLKTGDGASVDIIMDKNRPVYNWIGSGMKDAPASTEDTQNVRDADQICVIFD